MLPIADSESRVGSRLMSSLCVPITWLRNTAVSAFALSTIALHVGARPDAEVLGDARGRARPGHVAVLDEQLGHRVAAAGVDALDHRDVPDDRVGDRCVWPAITRSTVVSCSASAIPMIGPCQGEAAVSPMALDPSAAPSWMTHDLHVTPCARSRCDSCLIRSRLVEERRPFGRSGAHELGRVHGRADHADAHAVDPEHRRRLDPGRRSARSLVDDVRRQERVVRPRLLGEDARRGRSRTRGCRSSWRRAPTRSPRRSSACPRAAPRSAARRRRCHRPPAAVPARAARRLLVEHRGELRRAAERLGLAVDRAGRLARAVRGSR